MLTSNSKTSLYMSRSRAHFVGNTLASIFDGTSTTFEEVFKREFLEGSPAWWWLHLTNPSFDDAQTAFEAVSLPLATKEAIRDRVADIYEDAGSHKFVAYSLSKRDRFYAIITPLGIMTILDATLDDGSMTSELITRVKIHEASFGEKGFSSQWVCHVIIDLLNDRLQSQIADVEKEAIFIEKELYLHNGQSGVRSLLLRMCNARKRTVELMRMFQKKPAILKCLMQQPSIAETDSMNPLNDMLLSIVHSHLSAMIDSVSSLEGIIARSFINYISIMRVKMVHSNSSMEQIVGRVALIGLVLLPSHLVTSAWAMNVPVPGEHYKGEGWFWGVIGLIIFLTAVFAGFAFYYYRRAANSIKISPLIDSKSI